MLLWSILAQTAWAGASLDPQTNSRGFTTSAPIWQQTRSSPTGESPAFSRVKDIAVTVWQLPRSAVRLIRSKR